jgi:hypothetical protein
MIKLSERPEFIGGRRILADPISGTAVLEYGTTEILPPIGAISKHPVRLCRPGRQPSRAQPRGKPGFSTLESKLGERDGLSAGGSRIRTIGSGASGEADAILPVKDRPR